MSTRSNSISSDRQVSNPDRKRRSIGLWLLAIFFASMATLVTVPAIAAAQDSNLRPVAENPGDQTSERGDNADIDLVATDPDGDPVTWSITGLPRSTVLVTATGAIVGSITESGLFTVTATPSDAGGAGEPITFEWLINSAPAVFPIAAQEIGFGQSDSVQAIVNDIDGNVAGWIATGLPPGISLDAGTGLMSGVTTEAGTFTVTVTATDTFDASGSVTFDWVVTSGPQIVQPAFRLIYIGTPVTVQLAVTDPDPGPLTWSATELPDGLTITADGEVSGTPTTAAIYHAAVSVENEAGETDSIIWTWTVREDFSEVTVVPSCTAEGGQVDFELDNPNPTPSFFDVRFPEFPRRQVQVSGFDAETVSFTGQVDGIYNVIVRVNGRLLLDDTVEIFCQAEVTASWTCLAGNGLVTVALNNLSPAAGTFEVLIGTISRSVDLGALETTSVRVSGRSDGLLDVAVFRDGVALEALDPLVIDCDPNVEVAFAQSCLSENGRFDITVTNVTEDTADYAVSIEGLEPRIRTVDPGGIARVSVTGRPDKSYALEVLREDVSVWAESAVVACDPVLDQEISIVVSCLAENGRVDVTLLNTTDAPATYAVTFGTLASRSTEELAPGAIQTMVVTGRPDGPLAVVIERDGEVVSDTVETITCDAV